MSRRSSWFLLGGDAGRATRDPARSPPIRGGLDRPRDGTRRGERADRGGGQPLLGGTRIHRPPDGGGRRRRVAAPPTQTPAHRPPPRGRATRTGSRSVSAPPRRSTRGSAPSGCSRTGPSTGCIPEPTRSSRSSSSRSRRGSRRTRSLSTTRSGWATAMGPSSGSIRRPGPGTRPRPASTWGRWRSPTTACGWPTSSRASWSGSTAIDSVRPRT